MAVNVGGKGVEVKAWVGALSVNGADARDGGMGVVFLLSNAESAETV